MTVHPLAAAPAVADTETKRALLSQSVTQKTVMVGVLLLYGAAVLLRTPTTRGNYPECPIFHFTGCYCPGCGSMRATRALLTGDLASAFTYNFLFLPGLLIIVVWLFRKNPTFLTKTRNIWIGVAVVAVYTLVRNTGWGSFLAPHPF